MPWRIVEPLTIHYQFLAFLRILPAAFSIDLKL